MWRPFLYLIFMEDNKEELRPSKMRGVAFPKALGNATPLIFEGLSSSLLSSMNIKYKKGRHI